jgi:hypothetical protein
VLGTEDSKANERRLQTATSPQMAVKTRVSVRKEDRILTDQK